MTTLATLLASAKKLREQLAPPPEKDTRLPYLVIDQETGESLAGYEMHNAEHTLLARRRGLPPKEYLWDPFEDGIETAHAANVPQHTSPVYSEYKKSDGSVGRMEMHEDR
jgi:hypothetical protein